MFNPLVKRAFGVLGVLLLTSCSCEEAADVSNAALRLPDSGREVATVSGPEAPPGAEGIQVEDTGSAYPLQTNPLAGCSICHVDVEDEFLGTAHFTEKVGCKTCHGPSEEHLADENNEVKPDRLVAPDDVDELCGTCHDCSREEPKGALLASSNATPVCTGCHGPHDLALEVGQ